MNFFLGRVQAEDDRIRFVTDSNTITLPAGMNDALRAYNRQDMVLGVRPENLSLTTFQGQSENSISAAVNVIEPLGDRMEVYLSTSEGHKFIASVDPHVDIGVDQAVKMYIDLKKSHVFEPGETGRNVTLPKDSLN